MREVAFKYTLPIEKALTRDGKKVLVGLASGPEVDGDGERVTEEAIWSFAKQINEHPGSVPFRDAHAKDGVFRDLGYVSKAWVTDSGHLGVEVELEDENPAAEWLYKQIHKGKQFGFSVAGKVLDWAMEFAPEIGKSVRTFKNVVISEVSSTTRPAWTHSLGTVIAKAIQDAESSESNAAVGESVEDELQTEQETTEAPAVDETPEVAAEEAETEETTEEAVEETAEETPEAEAEAEVTEESEAAAEEPAAEETAEEVVAEAVAEEAEEASEPDDTTVEFRDMLVGLTAYMDQMLTKMGVAKPVMVAKSVSQDENEPTFEKALESRDSAIAELKGQVEELSKSLTQATARIEELENSPAGDESPTLVEKHNLTVDEIAKSMEDMDPRERLRLGLRFGLKPSR